MNTTNTREDKNNKIENVLVLQGGGSLGAFGCGVFKAIVSNNIEHKRSDYSWQQG
jgi:NTE family protein